MTATLFDLWDDELEGLRRGFVAAGLEPRLYRCWSNTTTEDLVAALDEYRTMPADLELGAVCRDLEAEIAYRTGGPRS